MKKLLLSLSFFAGMLFLVAPQISNAQNLPSSACAGKPNGTTCYNGSTVGYCANNNCISTTEINPPAQQPVGPRNPNPGTGGTTGQNPAPTAATTANSSATINLEPWYQSRDARSFLAGILGYIQSIIGYLAVLFIVLGGVLYILAGTGAGNEGMMKQAKACWTAALIGIVIAAAAPSFLLQIVDIVGIPANPTQVRSLKEIVMRALAFLLSITGSLAIIGLVVSGILYTTAAGQQKQIDSAKRAMTYSILGIIVAGLALILVQQIINLITK